MSLRTAVDQLAALSVNGVAYNYAIDEVPEALGRAQLPALLVLPLDMEEDRLFRERGQGFQAVAFADGLRTVTVKVTHLLLVTPVTGGAGMRTQLPALVDRMDDYFTALGADVRLGDALLEPARVQVEPGVFPLGTVSYYGCAFRHTWRLNVD